MDRTDGGEKRGRRKEGGSTAEKREKRTDIVEEGVGGREGKWRIKQGEKS